MTQPNAGAAPAPAKPAALPVRPRGQLALTLQEVLTVTVRLRANRQVAADAESFRTHVKQVMSMAEQEARRFGYAGEDVRLALYAVIALVDESVLNSGQPMFAGWPRKPLQEEIFGGLIAGEVFFQHLKQLLQRQDSEELADVLEVYQLCLLLGFRGRYSITGETGELHAFIAKSAEKIDRIRGGFGPLSPNWAPPAGERYVAKRDRWLRPLALGAGGTAVFALALYVVYLVSLGSGYSTLRDMVK